MKLKKTLDPKLPLTGDKRGFTLIELLVVISIISLLSSIVFSSLNSARMKARDSLRIQSLKEIQTALALYYDAVGHYPVPTVCDVNSGCWYASCWRTDANWIPDNGNYDWSSPYISKQVHDPMDTCIWPWDAASIGPTAAFAYYVLPPGQRYALAARLEDSGNRNTVQNAGTRGFDGVLLYPTSNWHPQAYAILAQ